jgi:hypothetical protein
MGIKFGEIDSGQILENEFRIGVLEKITEFLMNRNPMIKPTNDDIKDIKKGVVEQLKNKYPNSGIKFKED